MGHVHITREALKRFELDWIWWLVSPGNPLKQRGPAPLAARLAACRAIARHPRVRISDFEAQSQTRFTAATIRALQAAHPQVRFVWLMGADNLAQFHRWQDWRQIMARVPVGVLARPGERTAARTAPAARIFRPAMLKPAQAAGLARAAAPAWSFVNVPMVALSSSEIRAAGRW
jgi:nicotinate-nucleotide adenylyltransferase